MSSGTLGCLVEDPNQRLYLLSCAHVLSDAAGAAGDPVVQPGTYFGGTTARDQIASLTRSLLLTSGVCIADAAIAEVSNPGVVTPIVRYVGLKPSGTRQLTAVGVLVQKSGDMSGHTHGIVTGLHGTVGPYAANGVGNIYFVDVVVTSGMSRPGDSGSLLMDYTGQAIGVLFGGLKFAAAGAAPAYVVSWISPIEPILQNLGVRLVP